jgi:hypothetical protein
MKNIYLLIIAAAFFSQASAQRNSSHATRDQYLVAYVDVNSDGNYNSADGDYIISDDNIFQTDGSARILYGYNILWVFNDVGNHSTNKIIASGSEIIISPTGQSPKKLNRRHE